jgi:hypothetical protein
VIGFLELGHVFTAHITGNLVLLLSGAVGAGSAPLAQPLDSHVCGLRRRGIPRRTTFGPLPRATWALDCTRTAPACGADARAAAAGRSAVRSARDGHGGSARRSSSPLTSTSFFPRPSSRRWAKAPLGSSRFLRRPTPRWSGRPPQSPAASSPPLRARGVLEQRGAPEEAFELLQLQGVQVPPSRTARPRRPARRRAFVEGFSLHANTWLHENDVLGLERLCSCGARGPLSLDRLSALPDGRLAYRMKRPSPEFDRPAHGPPAVCSRENFTPCASAAATPDCPHSAVSTLPPDDSLPENTGCSSLDPVARARG